jgi:hypothetical protein
MRSNEYGNCDMIGILDSRESLLVVPHEYNQQRVASYCPQTHPLLHYNLMSTRQSVLERASAAPHISSAGTYLVHMRYLRRRANKHLGFDVMATRVEKPIWDKPNPKSSDKSTKLSPKQKTSAKKAADKAGRPYPNMVDNMNAAKKGS